MEDKKPDNAVRNANGGGKSGAPRETASKITVRDDWLKKYQGAVMKVPFELGSLMLARLFARTFYFTSRNIFYIQVFGPMILSGAEYSRIEDEMRKLFTDGHAELEKEYRQAEEVVRSAGIIHMANFNSPLKGEAAITSPLSRLHLNLFLTADRLELALHTLWLSNEIDIKAKYEAEYRVKQLLRGITRKVNAISIELRKKQTQSGKGKEMEEDIGGDMDMDMGDDDDVLLDSAGQPSHTL